MPSLLNQNPNPSNSAIDLSLIRMWLKQAGEIALSQRSQLNTSLKDDLTPVTQTDHDVETFLVERISEAYPPHRIITEESGIHAGTGEFVWVIDPIDGTRAYASGLPIWGISVGILRGAEPYAGVFYLPALGEMYWADHEGAFLNEEPLPEPTVDLTGPLAFVAVPSNAHQTYDIDFPRIRSLGSVAAHLAYIARGAAVGAVTRRIKIWDLAGVLPLLQQTGVVITYRSGRPFDMIELLSGSPAPEPMIVAHHSVIEHVRAIFQPKS